jgi:hypothetical protein
MAKTSAKNCVITCDNAAGSAQTISPDVVSYEIQYAVDPVEITGFGEGSHNFTPGQRVIGVTLDVLWNSAATTGAMTVLYGIVGSTTSKTLTIQPEGTGLTLTGEYMLEGISPAGDAKSDAIKLGSCKFSVMGATAPTWS